MPNEIQTWLDNSISTEESAYKLSMPLLVAAYIKDETAFENAYNKMQGAMINSDNGLSDSFKIWMNGRMLVAAVKMNDNIRADAKRDEVNKALQTVKPSLSLNNACVVWGRSYLALAYKGDESKAMNKRAIAGINGLDDDYKPWAWVMAAQAAAHIHDWQKYNQAIAALELNTQEGISKLHEKFPGKMDYYAWAIATLRVAARNIRDNMLFEALEQPTEEAIEKAKGADKMLATAYNDSAAKKLIEKAESTDKMLAPAYNDSVAKEAITKAEGADKMLATAYNDSAAKKSTAKFGNK